MCSHLLGRLGLCLIIAATVGCKEKAPPERAAEAQTDPVLLQVELGTGANERFSIQPGSSLDLSAELRARDSHGTISVQSGERVFLASTAEDGRRAVVHVENDGALRIEIFASGRAKPSGRPLRVTPVEAVRLRSEIASPTLALRLGAQKKTLRAEELAGLKTVNWRGNKKPRPNDAAWILRDALGTVVPRRKLGEIVLVAKTEQKTLSRAELESTQLLLKQSKTGWKVKKLSASGEREWRLEISEIQIGPAAP